MYGITLVLTIALLGGVVALLGDRVGMKVGKKRLSLFGLRPKYTSMIITVVTGILIAGTTLFLLAVVSSDVRTALFRMKSLQQELVSTRGDLVLEQERLSKLEAVTKTLQESKVALEVESERLRKEIQAYAGEATLLRDNGNMGHNSRIIFAAGEILATEVVVAGADATALQKQLETMVQTANQLALNRGARQSEHSAEALVLADGSADLPTYASGLALAQEPGVLRLVVTENTEVFTPLAVAFKYYPNQRVFRTGEVMAEIVVSPQEREAELSDRIVGLLTGLKQTALKEGMGVEAQALSQMLSPQQVAAVLTQIKDAKKPLVLQIVAAADLWRVDSALQIELQLKTQDG